jgi:hypothetical protein
LRARRYDEDESALALPLVDDFRASSLAAPQHDAVIENCLRLASIAAAGKRYREIPALLDPAEALLKNAEKGSLAEQVADDVSEAMKLAQSLRDPDTVAADVSARELTSLLQRWQFTPVLADPEAIGFVQSGTAGGNRPDGGRGLWNFQRERIWLNAPGGQGGFGLLDPNASLSRYVLRFQLSGRTTTAILILGAGPQQNLTGHVLGLDSTLAGQIRTLPGLAQIASVSQPVHVPTDGWNNYEVVVDGPAVTMRLNGETVQRATVTGLQPGRVGLFAPLERRVPTHVLDVRNLRVLTLPD